jgi:formamidopyrimidine-DNA glycosylase
MGSQEAAGLSCPKASAYARAMPELAEVEYFRRRWNCGLNQRILTAELHAKKRVFRGIEPGQLIRSLTGVTLLGSEAHGKQMLFQFSKGGWLGVHLGMTGALRAESPTYSPARNDHLILRQRRQSLVFEDARQFGRVLFETSRVAPAWWTVLPPRLTSVDFTAELVVKFLLRHRRAPIKGVLLMQEGFPGIGNWMADEILWRAGIHPDTDAGRVHDDQARLLWRMIVKVCERALKIVAKDYSDPPPSWLFRHRWEPGGLCPKDKQRLDRAIIGGRTTAWCPKCQPRQRCSR